MAPRPALMCFWVTPAQAFYQGDSPRVTTMTGMLSRCRVACDRRRKPYSSEYSTMYSSCGHTVGGHHRSASGALAKPSYHIHRGGSWRGGAGGEGAMTWEHLPRPHMLLTDGEIEAWSGHSP